MQVSATKHMKNNNMAPLDLNLVIEAIQVGSYESAIEKIRLLRQAGDEASNEAADKLKKALLYFMPCLLTSSKAVGEVGIKARPTGIIQFDLDLKHNPNLDMSEAFKTLSVLPFMLYAFSSPSGGLKFAILSNFKGQDGESFNSVKARFEQAYFVAKREILTHVNAHLDDVVKSIQQGCFISSDENVFYNPKAEMFDVGETTYHEPIEQDYVTSSTTVSGPPLEELLPFISPYLDYMERLPIICGAMSVYGRECIPSLLNHFATENSKLRKQLEKIYNTERYGSYGTVVNAAVRGGYKFSAPRKLTGQNPQPSNHTFEAQLTKEQGKALVKQVVANSILNGENCYLSVPCGLGKSTEAIEQIALHIKGKKFALTAPTHALAEQHTQNLKTMLLSIYGEEEGQELAKRVKHIYGATSLDEDGKPLCKKSGLRAKLNEFGTSLSVNDCFNCPHFNSCKYVHQFEDTDLVRIMVTDNLFLSPSKWWHGVEVTDGKKTVKTVGFEPDFIIVDEDSIKLDSATFASSQTLKGLMGVLEDLGTINGEVTKAEIALSFRKHQKAILKDFKNAEEVRRKMVFLVRNGAFVTGTPVSNEHFRIIKSAHDFLTSNGDARFLRGMTYRKASIENGFEISAALIQHDLKRVHPFFQGKPTLFLDATANEKVVNAVYPNAPFKKISVTFPDEVKVYQLTNSSVSKAHLNKDKNVERMVDFVKSKIKEHGTVESKIGLITYRQLPKIDDFSVSFAGRIGSSASGYFGGMRGSNILEDVDILVIIGRQKLDSAALNSYAHAVFDQPYVNDEATSPRPIRMQDGTVKTLESLYPSGVIERAIYDHFCTAETIQMIGRARPYWSGPKIIIYCSNEALGGDIEVTDFISFEDGAYSDVVENAKEIGVINIGKPKDRAAVGISDYDWREKREEVVEALTSAGGNMIIMTGVDSSRNKFSNEYIVFDPKKLAAITANTNFTVEEVDRFTKLFG